MSVKRYLASFLLGGGVILATWCTAQVASAAEPFVLTSSAFKDGATIPAKHGGNLKSNQNCIGDNVSPPFSWANPPDGTKSFAILMADPEGRSGLGVVQWVAYGIPASTTGFAEGDASQPSDKYVSGKSTVGLPPYYLGPCAPRGAPHHYVFTLIATDLEPQALPPGLTRDELLAALAGHSKGATGLVGLYARP
jgi:Raf kinase inhibitor-like YbhB/YbcL family protein